MQLALQLGQHRHAEVVELVLVHHLLQEVSWCHGVMVSWCHGTVDTYLAGQEVVQTDPRHELHLLHGQVLVVPVPHAVSPHLE